MGIEEVNNLDPEEAEFLYKFSIEWVKMQENIMQSAVAKAFGGGK